MRVAGVYCGALKAPVFAGSVLKMDFNTLPFIDLTNRHTITNNGVTISGGKAFFNNPAATDYRLETDASNDFDFQRDFDISLKVTPSSFSKSQQLFLVVGNLPSNSLSLRFNSTGSMGINAVQGGSTVFDDNSLASFSMGVEYTVKLVVRGSSVKVFANSSRIFNITLSGRIKLPRKVYLSSNSTGNSFHGFIEDLDYKVLKPLAILDFETFPFVDTTGRHTVSNFGVTQSGGSAYFNNPSDSSLARLDVLGNQDDFNLQNDFDISFTANVASFSGRSDQILFSIENDSGTSVVECYVKNTGQIYLNFPSATFITSTGIIGTATSYNIRIERRGTSAQIWVNDIARAIVTPSIPAILNVPRKLVLGASARTGVNGFGINGTIDNFKFDVC